MNQGFENGGATTPALELQSISKTFGTTQALDSVDLTIRKGEVIGLLGQNGSGKSTLVRVLTGFHMPDRGGRAFVEGREVQFPLVANEIGVSCVYQDLGLASGLTVLENLLVSRWTSKQGKYLINWREQTSQARAMLNRFQVSLPLHKTVGELPLKDQAVLAIVRSAEEIHQFQVANAASHGVLLLDEPTVFLSEKEEVFLIELIRRITDGGASVLMVSHDLPFIRQVADRVTVLRNGRVAGHADIADITDDDLASLVTGVPHATKVSHIAPVETGTRALNGSDAHGVVLKGVRGGRVRNVDMSIRAGEILGLAGLLGSGVEELPELVFGLRSEAEGEVALGTETLALQKLTPIAAIRAGIGFVPPDRNLDGLVGLLTIEENMLLLNAPKFYRGGWFRKKLARIDSSDLCTTFRVYPNDPTRPVSSLSGGNQQKVLLAKWCSIRPRFLLLHEPAQGVDVGARAEIFRIVSEITKSGTSVLWITTDFNEMAMIADRVVVMSNGRVAGELVGEQVTSEEISRAVLTWEAAEAKDDSVLVRA